MVLITEQETRADASPSAIGQLDKPKSLLLSTNRHVGLFPRLHSHKSAKSTQYLTTDYGIISRKVTWDKSQPLITQISLAV